MAIAAGAILIAVSITALTTPNYRNSTETNKETVVAKNLHPKIQAAILLDVSNSMDGLISQAKAQLWNMVSIMGKAQCDGITPQIEIALYEYGRPDNGIK